MADMDYYGADYGAENPSRVFEAMRSFGIVNWAGAATSLGLTAAMAVWAVDLTFRDVSGVPVIRAIEGPMRIAPENPGGTVAPFQGLALSDITSGGAAAPAPEQIVLAPAPVELQAPALGERRQAMAALAQPTPAEDPATEAPARIAAAEPAPVGPAPAGVDLAALPTMDADAANHLAEKLNGSAEADDLDPDMAVAAVLEAEIDAGIETGDVLIAEAETVETGGPGIATSLRPRMRPGAARRPAAPAQAQIVQASASAPYIPRSAIAAAVAAAQVPTEAPARVAGTQVASTSDEIPTTRDVDASAVPTGTRVVQLGAFNSEAVARSEWERLSGRFSSYMDGKGRMIQKARSGGRDFWRLRVVGFEDAADARRFCSALQAQNAACMPVTMR